MPQFRPFPSYDGFEDTEFIDEALVTDTPPPRYSPVPPIPKSPFPRTSPQVPIVLLSGPHTTEVSKQLAAIARTTSTNQHPTLETAMQRAMGVGTRSTGRMTVIPAEIKRKTGSRSQSSRAKKRRLNPRVRHTFVLLVTLSVIVTTLLTLVPLSENSNNAFFDTLSSWLHAAQMDGQYQFQNNVTQKDYNPNNDNLPYMNIPNSPYVMTAQEDAVLVGISPVYFVRQINQESHFNPDAVSATNAEGIAQFEPSTAAALGIDPWDPVQALSGASKLMASYSNKYNGNYAMALAAYNAGGGALQSAVYICGDSWLSCMTAQTQGYVYQIMGVTS